MAVKRAREVRKAERRSERHIPILSFVYIMLKSNRSWETVKTEIISSSITFLCRWGSQRSIYLLMQHADEWQWQVLATWGCSQKTSLLFWCELVGRNVVICEKPWQKWPPPCLPKNHCFDIHGAFLLSSMIRPQNNKSVSQFGSLFSTMGEGLTFASSTWWQEIGRTFA